MDDDMQQRSAGLLTTLTAWFIATTVALISGSALADEFADKTYKAQVLLDEYYGDHENIAGAERYLNEVFEQNPDFVPAHIQAARVTLLGGHIVSYEFQTGTLETARALLMKAKQLEPKNAEVYVLLGHLHFLEQDPDAALKALSTAQKLGTNNPWLQNNFADVFLSRDDLKAADDFYQQVEKRGAGKTAQQHKAFVHALQKRQEVAAWREDNDEVKRLGKLATEAAAPNDAWTWGEVANMFFIQGFFDDAIRNARKALSIMSYGVGRENLALGLYGKWARMVAAGQGGPEAERYFKEAYELHPDLDAVIWRFQRSAAPVKGLAWVVGARKNNLQN